MCRHVPQYTYYTDGGCPQSLATAASSCDCRPYHVDAGKTYLVQIAAFGDDDFSSADASADLTDDTSATNDVTLRCDFAAAPSYDAFAGAKLLPSASGTVVVDPTGASLEGGADVESSEYSTSFTAILYFRDFAALGGSLTDAVMGRYAALTTAPCRGRRCVSSFALACLQTHE